MAGYWSNVAKLAFRGPLGRARVDPPVRAALLIGPAVVGGALAWILSGNAAYGLSAAIVAIVLLFGWKLAAIPPRLAKEAADALSEAQRLAKEATERVSEIQRRLDEIGADRPISYETLTLDAQRRDGIVLLSGVTLVFQNASDRTMHYTFKDVTLHVNDDPVALQDPEEASGLIGHREEMGYVVAPLEPVEIPRFSEIIVDFNIDYDNQPPLRTRTTGRRVSCKLESLEPLAATFVILEEREM
jgi:hypothetical protein